MTEISLKYNSGALVYRDKILNTVNLWIMTSINKCVKVAKKQIDQQVHDMHAILTYRFMQAHFIIWQGI